MSVYAIQSSEKEKYDNFITNFDFNNKNLKNFVSEYKTNNFLSYHDDFFIKSFMIFFLKIRSYLPNPIFSNGILKSNSVNCEFTIATINNNVDICKILLEANANIEYQDIYGNNVLNYAILNKSKELINLYYDKVDINLCNISGNISINLFFDNDYNLDKLDEYQFKYFLNKANNLSINQSNISIVIFDVNKLI